LKRWTENALGDLASRVDLAYSTSCLNILPRGIEKGKGIEFLVQKTGIRAESMLGVGDSDVDLPFLKRVGHSAAPANAVPAVKAIVDYVSQERTGAGVLDILKEYRLLP
jgi:hydroxymethylpyrimidine pyrophosphatase-like HAD family hydrolase